MPYDGSGIYEPLAPPVYPAVAGDIIYAERFNAIIGDIVTALTNAVCKDGQSTLHGDLNLGGRRVTNTLAASVAGHLVEYAQWQASFISPNFETPRGNSPDLGDNSERLATTAWARLLLGSAAGLNLPPIVGQQGALTTDGTIIEWSNAVPDFVLTQQGIA
jgi:hypothetical protein